MLDKEFRDIVESNKEGTYFTYKDKNYLIITGIIVEELETGKYYMKGLDF